VIQTGNDSHLCGAQGRRDVCLKGYGLAIIILREIAVIGDRDPTYNHAIHVLRGQTIVTLEIASGGNRV
jgi:hypothetical protein